jgi:outer membrane protein
MIRRTHLTLAAAVSTLAPAPALARTLSLQEAERYAMEHQPSLAEARATTDVARAQADQAFAPLLPQVTGTASYGRQTANFVQRPGALPSNVNVSGRTPNADTFDAWNFGLTASQLVWDFGQTTGRHNAAVANAEAQREQEVVTQRNTLFNVRSAYFQAWANHALVRVAEDNLTNQSRHQEQVEGFVRAGSRPEIDLAQVRADRANAALQLANAESAYESAKALLVQSMGVETPFDFDVADEELGAVPGEDAAPTTLVASATEQRPEVRALEKQENAQELTVRAAKGAYGPSLGVSANATEAGVKLDALTWNFGAQATLTWPIFQGGLTNATVRAAEANVTATRAALAVTKQQVQFDVTQALVAVRAAKISVATAKEVEANAQVRLRLAEGRYAAGAGSIIELQDAQVAETTAAGQVIQAEFTLYSARASLVRALGRN